MRPRVVLFIISLIFLVIGGLLLTHFLSEEAVDEISFDRKKWMEKEGSSYSFRNQMVRDVLYNDTIRTLNKQELIQLLGEPSKTVNRHMYYDISKKRLGLWTVKARSLVVKVDSLEAIEWIKLYN